MEPTESPKPTEIKAAGNERARLVTRLENLVDAALEHFSSADLLELVRARIHRRPLSEEPIDKGDPRIYKLREDVSRPFDPRHGEIIGAGIAGQASNDALMAKMEADRQVRHYHEASNADAPDFLEKINGPTRPMGL